MTLRTEFLQALLLALLIVIAPVSQAASEDKITMNMRNADIRNVIQWVADFTGKNILVHNEVQGNVTVISGGPVSKNDAYDLFLSTLAINGYVAQEKDQVISIVPESMAAQGHAPFSASSGSQVITKILPIKNIPATQLVSVLKPLLPKHSQLSADGNSNSLVVVDRADNIRKVESIIARMDKPNSGDFDIVKLRHANASELVNSLDRLMPAYGDPASPSLSISFSVDERSNSILVFGDAAKRRNIRNLIQQMDQPVTGEGSTQVVYLNYVDAGELVPILQSMSGVHSEEQGGRGSPVSVTASESTNALVISAPPALMADMKKVISQIDIRKAQVLIEAMVVEVNHSIVEDIGVNWVTTDSAVNSADGGVFAAGTTLGDLTPLSVVNPGAGLTFGFFRNGTLRAAVRALAGNSKANILSTPTIIAMDNEEADLLVGQNIPLRTGESTGAASTTADPFTTIERQDIGTSLRVTPRINQGDSIALQIEQRTESLDQSIAPELADLASDLITRKTEMRTRALIKDGEVLVIGGLIRDEEREVRQKIPVLGDVPVLGKLFSSKGIDKTKNNLMVFIHPVIVKDAAHRQHLTSQRYNFMREKQQQSANGDWLKAYKFEPLLPEFSLYTPDAFGPGLTQR